MAGKMLNLNVCIQLKLRGWIYKRKSTGTLGYV